LDHVPLTDKIMAFTKERRLRFLSLRLKTGQCPMQTLWKDSAKPECREQSRTITHGCEPDKNLQTLGQDDLTVLPGIEFRLELEAKKTCI
jgi:hypothetical protein